MSQVICPKCTTKVPVSSNFCSHCGWKLDAGVQDIQAPRGPDRLSAPLVGRDTELSELVERWRTARGGEPWVEVRGEMGIGKTRLVKEAAKQIEGRRLLTVVASSGTKHRPFGMARRLVHAVICEVTGRTSPPETREKLAEGLAPLKCNLEERSVDAFWRLAPPN